MRFIFKTDYEQDIKLIPHSGYVWSYGLLLALLALAPFVLGNYLQSQIVFVFIYAMVGVALIILTGSPARRRWATRRSSPSAPTRPRTCSRRVSPSSPILSPPALSAA